MFFFGGQYTFPKEISDYVFYSKRVQESGSMFFEKLTGRIEEKWYDYPDTEFENLFKDEGNRIIRILAEDGIYDVTLSELINQNSGYKFFKEFTEDGFTKLKNIDAELTEEYVRGLRNAQSVADSQVTGSGVSLYSSSLLAHMTFMALESNTIKKQERQAEKAYRNALSSLDKTNRAKGERKQNELFYNYIYPAYGKAVTMFLGDMLDIYLKILQKHSIYDYSKLKSFDVEKSMELLDNLSVIDDKKQVLIHAFINCPYNTRVYEEAINFGVMDDNTFETAKIFGKDTEVVACIKEYCIEHLEEKDTVMKYMDIISSYENIDYNTALKQLYQEEKKQIEEWYKNLRYLLDNPSILKRRIESKLSSNQMDVATVSTEEITSKLDDFINKMDYVRVDSLLKYGIVSYSKLNMHNATLNSLDEINSKYKELLLEKIVCCIEELKEEKREIEEKEEAEKNERWVEATVVTVSSIFLTVLLFVPIENSEFLLNCNIIVNLILQCVLFYISILAVNKKITQKKIGIISGWIGCIVSGLNVIFLGIATIGIFFGD